MKSVKAEPISSKKRYIGSHLYCGRYFIVFRRTVPFEYMYESTFMV